jgi:hypothetical protein
MNPNEQKAAELMSEQLVRSEPGGASCRAAAKMLNEHGLIVTPLHERALAACEALARCRVWRARVLSTGFIDWPSPERSSAERIGRESLAAKESAGRYYVEQINAGDEYRVRDRTRPTAGVRGFGTKAECEAIKAALEALDAKESANV